MLTIDELNHCIDDLELENKDLYLQMQQTKNVTDSILIQLEISSNNSKKFHMEQLLEEAWIQFEYDNKNEYGY